jgi:hypothetical protein
VPEVGEVRVIPAGLPPLVVAQVITARRLMEPRIPEAVAAQVATAMVVLAVAE